MANAIELTLMAGRIYQSTRDKINWLPDLSSLGWIERIDKTQSLPSGLKAMPADGFNSFAATINSKVANDEIVNAWMVAA